MRLLAASLVGGFLAAGLLLLGAPAWAAGGIGAVAGLIVDRT